MKNGLTFTTVINSNDFESGIWDPYHYRDVNNAEVLGKYVEIKKIKDKSFSNNLDFSPVEYRDIPKGNIIGINLSVSNNKKNIRVSIVPPHTLLFGTMRAYLGNVFVTPQESWISRSNCWFGVNSEFVIVNPKDGLLYFWWAYLKSHSFLSSLPTGTGGTRPRISCEQLSKIPSCIPDISVREQMNKEIEEIAKHYWSQAMQLQTTLLKYELL